MPLRLSRLFESPWSWISICLEGLVSLTVTDCLLLGHVFPCKKRPAQSTRERLFSRAKLRRTRHRTRDVVDQPANAIDDEGMETPEEGVEKGTEDEEDDRIEYGLLGGR